MTKLMIQIPCFEEAEALGVALAELPRAVPGIDRLEWLIIDDGCADEAVAATRGAGP